MSREEEPLCPVPRRSKRRCAGRGLILGDDQLTRVCSMSNLNEAASQRVVLKAHRSHSASNLKTADIQSDNLFILSMFSLLRRDIKSDTENLLSQQFSQ